MLTFDEKNHLYFIDGEPLPSVSKVIEKMFGSQYDKIPKHILENASRFGTAVHEAIEFYNEEGFLNYDDDPLRNHCLDEFVRLKEEHGLKITHSEQMVHFKDIYAGTFDALGENKESETLLMDWKTTAKFDERHLRYQLNLYRLGYEWKHEVKIDKLLAVWLPKRQRGKVVEIDMIDDKQLLKEVEIALRNKNDSDTAGG